MNESLRLLHIVPTYLPALRYGGPIRSVHALCRALAADGHDVHVFTTSVDGPADSDVPLARPVDLEGVKVTYFPSRRLRRLYWSPPMRRALAASVGGFDVVHLHAVYLWPIWAGARAARAQGVPYVISPRGMLVPELMRRKSRWVKAAWIALIERTNLEAAAAIHTTSSVEAGHLSGFGWKLPPIATIPHGVDDPPPPSAAPLSADIAAATARRPARPGVRPHQLGEGARSPDRGPAAGAGRPARAGRRRRRWLRCVTGGAGARWSVSTGG